MNEDFSEDIEGLDNSASAEDISGEACRDEIKNTETEAAQDNTDEETNDCESGDAKKEGSLKRKKPSLYFWLMIAAAAAAAVLNVLSFSRRFCDFYVANIFPLWINTYSRFSGLFSFSLGEYLLIAAVFFIAAALISALLLIFLRKKKGYRRYAVIYFKSFFAVAMAVFIIMTLNCTLLYGTSELKLSAQGKGQEFTVDELENLRNMIVTECNALAEQMQRDENGYVVYSGNMYQAAKAAMLSISSEFPRFSGYYPKPKPISGSVFMTQTYTSGVYFPFTLEANYNNMMYIVNYPAVICHEYSHLKGYILEDEANFFGYLACINSDDPFVRYSGYSSVLGYVDDSYYNSVSHERYCNQPEISSLSYYDYIFLTPEKWEKVEEESVFDTDKVDDISDAVTDTMLQLSGVEDGILSYNRVTELLLEYYKERGEI